MQGTNQQYDDKDDGVVLPPNDDDYVAVDADADNNKLTNLATKFDMPI